MERGYAEGDWVETDARLVIRKSDLDPDLPAETIPVVPSALNPEEGVWSLTVHAGLPEGTNGQLRQLLEAIEPFSARLTDLGDRGYEMSIRVSGFVGRGSAFTLTQDVVARLAALNIPLTVSPSTSDR
ncbi:hypothetical protein [Streptomyces sp. NPDC000851]